MATLPDDFKAGNCDKCPASAEWKMNKYAKFGLLCFHHVVFEFKSGKPIPCADAKKKCLLKI